MRFKRYAIYFTPPPGPLAEFGATWLGWDITQGCLRPHLECPNLPFSLPELTDSPRKYGLHATIKPPFRLAARKTDDQISQALAQFCSQAAAPKLEGFSLATLGRFLALVPTGNTNAINHLAASVVSQFDSFRAPLTEQEFERRQSAHLNAEQQDRLIKWGYPHVMEGFRFHITLTGKMPKRDLPAVQEYLAPFVAPFCAPMAIDAISLVGEADDGFFHLIERHSLGECA